MIEQEIDIRTVDGSADGIFYRPEEGRRLPGVIFLTDIGGIRPSQREMARCLAGEGYSVLLPNVFYRTRRPPMFDFPFKMEEERSRKRLKELSGPLTPEAAERDATTYIDFLTEQTSVAPGPIGAVGYCFSGALAMRTAAARPDRVAAAASFHGGRLFTDSDTSPHLLLPRIKARLYFGHAMQDQSMPAEAISKLEQALRAWGGEYKSELYEGAYHGWTVPDSPSYNKAQAERAFQKLKELFAGSLHPDGGEGVARITI